MRHVLNTPARACDGVRRGFTCIHAELFLTFFVFSACQKRNPFKQFGFLLRCIRFATCRAFFEPACKNAVATVRCNTPLLASKPPRLRFAGLTHRVAFGRVADATAGILTQKFPPLVFSHASRYSRGSIAMFCARNGQKDRGWVCRYPRLGPQIYRRGGTMRTQYIACRKNLCLA